jgi:hypothetical protein
MTSAEATALAASLNASLVTSGASGIVKYSVFAYWDIKYNKLYNVVLYPKSRDAKFETATASEKLAFARVSLISQLSAPAAYTTFNTTFEANALLDTELNNYLKP